ncbi:GGDEF domain-containing protein [Hydrogenovibrio sp. 3SP14C1]|uniref:sensor domain-containing diguanylate cyclase n=1 Tax=Hydrogenovibrio sp. 3SP14C1 TaxID=3038774 RepID=UPI00241734D5|nr:GGDEF domain-containing protein [Hydrogenovibrio sp. 3SP14C1]MDG4812488.1 GGDEF domain-containing protein [Hydrogenovibrio sp. 3SP14C1]
MISLEQMPAVLDALPDPAFLFSRSGKYVAVYGGRDSRYYHDGSGLVGLYIADLIEAEKANWFLGKIEEALQSKKLLIEEYELSNKDVKGLPYEGPQTPIWFEGRIQALDFLVDEEEVVLWVASNISERHDLENKLRELSDTDQLTGIFNRRRLEHDFPLHFEAFKRHATPTDILMFDLDNLKQVNDRFGHHAGDDAILAVTRICQSHLSKKDITCRFGGDEFIVILAGIELEEAVHLSEKLSVEFKQGLEPFCVDNIKVSVSMGVTTIKPTDNSYQETLRRVDQALYTAKKNGKNQVVIV